jgi:hypothetical protein
LIDAGVGGMIAASFIGIFAIPLLYVMFHALRERVKGRPGKKAAAVKDAAAVRDA